MSFADIIDEHAIDRYIERWRASASREQARHEIFALLADSVGIQIEMQPYGAQQIRVAYLGQRSVHLVVWDIVLDGEVRRAVHTVLPDHS